MKINIEENHIRMVRIIGNYIMYYIIIDRVYELLDSMIYILQKMYS